MRKKILSMVMAGTLALSFTACGGSSSTDTEKIRILPARQKRKQKIVKQRLIKSLLLSGWKKSSVMTRILKWKKG